NMSFYKSRYPAIPVESTEKDNTGEFLKYESSLTSNNTHQTHIEKKKQSSINTNRQFNDVVRIYNGKVETKNDQNMNEQKFSKNRESPLASSNEPKFSRNRESSNEHKISRNMVGGRNESSEADGPYAKVEQQLFVAIDDDLIGNAKMPVGVHYIDEEIMGKEIVPGEIYDFNLNLQSFISELSQRISQSSNLKLQIIDNYYLYQYIFSIKNGITTNYTDQEIDWSWNRTSKWYKRRIKRTYGDPISDLDSYRDYHAIVRIIRFQVPNKITKVPEIFEIIIPRSSNNLDQSPLYTPPNNLIQLLLKNDIESINLPKGSEFMIRRLST
ncbi:MAG: hypothetical protein WD512_00275, partial [Candidatus Paceibacterota bacterium]